MFNSNAFYNNEQWQDIVRRVTKLPADRIYMVMPRNQGKTMFSNMMKYYLEELEKMTKIDETKQYKFSEIIAMVESDKLPAGTKVSPNGVFDYLLVGEGSNVNKLYTASGGDVIMFNISMAFSELWTIKLPAEDKYYLEAPVAFGLEIYLNFYNNDRYELMGKRENDLSKTKFTQSEIDDMPFDINFFEKIKVEGE